MKTSYFLSALGICALTLVGCSSNNDLNSTEYCCNEIIAESPLVNEEFLLSPEENESFILEGINDIIAEAKTLNTVVEEYRQAMGINEEIIVTPNIYEDIYNCCMNRYYNANITDIENTSEIQDHLRYGTNSIYSDLFYSTVAEMVSGLSLDAEINVDYNQFATEEAYILSNLVAMYKGLQHYTLQFTQVASASGESDCWNNFYREIAMEFGYAAISAVISGGVSAATLLCTGPAFITLIIANAASTALTIYQLCVRVKLIYIEYVACMDSITHMDGDNIIVTNPNDDSTNESEWDNWISFLGCHVVNSTALISQIDECLQEQLIIQ